VEFSEEANKQNSSSKLSEGLWSLPEKLVLPPDKRLNTPPVDRKKMYFG
jgi:hypothetical protein